mmetsp:Transcript_61852/g.170262  ORF Transcript_61852/g.170262 Transcript_61852/m.170262 type:complete len:2071 (-) Transcript_61852:610-6822(-)
MARKSALEVLYKVLKDKATPKTDDADQSLKTWVDPNDDGVFTGSEPKLVLAPNGEWRGQFGTSYWKGVIMDGDSTPDDIKLGGHGIVKELSIAFKGVETGGHFNFSIDDVLETLFAFNSMLYRPLTASSNPFSALRVLNLHRSGVSGDLQYLYGCSNLLEYVDLGYCDIKGDIKVFHEMTHLKELTLVDCRNISGSIDGFEIIEHGNNKKQCHGLEVLNLGLAHLVRGDLSCVVEGRKIRKLDLRDTRVKGNLNCFRLVKSLEQLDLTGVSEGYLSPPAYLAKIPRFNDGSIRYDTKEQCDLLKAFLHHEWVESLANRSKTEVQAILLTDVGTPTDQWTDIVTKSSDTRMVNLRKKLEKSTGSGVGASKIHIMGRSTSLGDALKAAAIFALDHELRGGMGVGGVYNAYGAAALRHAKALPLSITAALRLKKWNKSLTLINLGVPLDRRSVLECLVHDGAAQEPSELFDTLVREQSNKELACKLMYLMGGGQGKHGRGPGGKVDPLAKSSDAEEEDTKVDAFVDYMADRQKLSNRSSEINRADSWVVPNSWVGDAPDVSSSRDEIDDSESGEEEDGAATLTSQKRSSRPKKQQVLDSCMKAMAPRPAVAKEGDEVEERTQRVGDGGSGGGAVRFAAAGEAGLWANAFRGACLVAAMRAEEHISRFFVERYFYVEKSSKVQKVPTRPTLIVVAMEYGHYETAQRMLDLGATIDVDVVRALVNRESHGPTPTWEKVVQDGGELFRSIIRRSSGKDLELEGDAKAGAEASPQKVGSDLQYEAKRADLQLKVAAALTILSTPKALWEAAPENSQSSFAREHGTIGETDLAVLELLDDQSLCPLPKYKSPTDPSVALLPAALTHGSGKRVLAHALLEYGARMTSLLLNTLLVDHHLFAGLDTTTESWFNLCISVETTDMELVEKILLLPKLAGIELGSITMLTLITKIGQVEDTETVRRVIVATETLLHNHKLRLMLVNVTLEDHLKELVTSKKGSPWHTLTSGSVYEKLEALETSDEPHLRLKEIVKAICSVLRKLPYLYDNVSHAQAVSLAHQEITKAMHEAVLFCGRFKLEDKLHESATCMVYSATDVGGGREEEIAGERPVVIKLMLNRSQFLREVEQRKELDSDFVVDIVAHSPLDLEDEKAGAEEEGGEEEVEVVQRQQTCGEELRQWKDHCRTFELFQRSGNGKDRSYFDCGIVMEAAQRNLMVVLVQERVSIVDVKAIFRSILECLKHMHKRGKLHADIKPLNVVRMDDGKWKLIDLDATVEIGKQPIGAKTSTGYMPPETAYRKKQPTVTDRQDGDGGGTDAEDVYFAFDADALIDFKTPVENPDSFQLEKPTDAEYELVEADPTFDLWALGVILFRALSHTQLFDTTDRDNLRGGAAARALVDWNVNSVTDACDRVEAFLRKDTCRRQERLMALDLLAWLLQPKPEDRPQSCEEVLEHRFLASIGRKENLNVTSTGLGMCLPLLHRAAAFGEKGMLMSFLEPEEKKMPQPNAFSSVDKHGKRRSSRPTIEFDAGALGTKAEDKRGASRNEKSEVSSPSVPPIKMKELPHAEVIRRAQGEFLYQRIGRGEGNEWKQIVKPAELINLKDPLLKRTALHYAAAEGRVGVVEYMLKQPGIDVDSPDGADRSALQLVRHGMLSYGFSPQSQEMMALRDVYKLLAVAEAVSVVRHNQKSGVGVTAAEGNKIKAYCTSLVPKDISPREFYPKVMISYATGTRKGLDERGNGLGMQYCKLLVQKLERKGIPCFTGMHAQAGDNWKMYYDKVQKAEIMLVIQTPGYYRSDACLDEITAAHRCGLYVIPLIFEYGDEGQVPWDLPEKMWSQQLDHVEKQITDGKPGAEEKLDRYKKAIKFLGGINSDPAPVSKTEAKQGKGTVLSPLEKRDILEGQNDILEKVVQRCKDIINRSPSQHKVVNTNVENREVDDEIALLKRQLAEKEVRIAELVAENERLCGGGGGQGRRSKIGRRVTHRRTAEPAAQDAGLLGPPGSEYSLVPTGQFDGSKSSPSITPSKAVRLAPLTGGHAGPNSGSSPQKRRAAPRAPATGDADMPKAAGSNYLRKPKPIGSPDR